MSNTRKALLICIIAVLAVVAGSIWSVTAAEQNDITSDESKTFKFNFFRMWGRPFRSIMGSLTEEQREELLTEIKNLIETKLLEWDIEPPEPLLTDEQLEQLKSKIEEMRDSGATCEEIRETIAGMLEDWGVELPERPAKHNFFHGKRFLFRGRQGCRRNFEQSDTN